MLPVAVVDAFSFPMLGAWCFEDFCFCFPIFFCCEVSVVGCRLRAWVRYSESSVRTGGCGILVVGGCYCCEDMLEIVVLECFCSSDLLIYGKVEFI